MPEGADVTATGNLDQFLAQLGHDLRNPLNALAAALGVLDHYPPGSPQAEEARRVITRQAERLRRLIDDRLLPLEP